MTKFYPVFAHFLSTLKYTFASSYEQLFFVLSPATIYAKRTVIYLELFWYKFLPIKGCFSLATES